MFADLEKRDWDPTGPVGGLSVRAIQISYGCINIPVQIPVLPSCVELLVTCDTTARILSSQLHVGEMAG